MRSRPVSRRHPPPLWLRCYPGTLLSFTISSAMLPLGLPTILSLYSLLAKFSTPLIVKKLLNENVSG